MRLILAAWLLSATATAQVPGFVRVPPGTIGELRLETPIWMGKTEVTVLQFSLFVKVTDYKTTAERANAVGTWKTPGFKLASNQPVVYVTVQDASAYCEWIGGRLPTDAEWEYSARAGSTARHYWGNTVDRRFLWYRANSGDRPHAVGTRRANRWGLYDMEGNVWEWTISPPVDGKAMANRRGGSWIDCENIESEPGRQPSPLIGLATFFKISVDYGHRYDDIGFRCVSLRDSHDKSTNRSDP